MTAELKTIPSVVSFDEQVQRQTQSALEAARDGDYQHAAMLLKAITKYVTRER